MAFGPTAATSSFSASAVAGPGVTAATYEGTAAAASGSFGASALAGAQAYATYSAVFAIGLTLIGLAKVGPDTTVNINGQPALKQLSGVGAFKQLLGRALALTAAVVGAVKTIQALFKHTSDAVAASTQAAVAANPTRSIAQAVSESVVPVETRVNPASEALVYALNTLYAFSTSTVNTSTVVLAASSATSVGLKWWEITQDFRKTDGNSYYNILLSTKNYTDMLCEVIPNQGILTLQQIIEASGNQDPYDASLGLLSPTLEEFAGVLQNRGFISGPTVALEILVMLSTTSTTTLSQLTNAKAKVDTYMTDLLNRLQADGASQSKYISQSSHLSQLMSHAVTANAIAGSHPPEVGDLYNSTLHPSIQSTVKSVQTLMNVTAQLSDPNNVSSSTQAAILSSATNSLGI